MYESLLPLAGVVLGAVLAGCFQYLTTKKQIQNDSIKLRTQILADRSKSVAERKTAYLLEWLPEFIYLADPEAHIEYDYKRALQLVHKIQLVLTPEQCEYEAKLNYEVGQLAALLQSAASGSPNQYNLLGAQNAVIESGRKVLKKLS
ncbi:TPA: hypothetical protein ACF35N_004556 [Vibrio parahaemolyticus]|uniref:hypothetical protein n=1 Tax=Vibrio parahaemolyticus TaxID=670 RepID=UPI00111E97D4|nr:hypothetical protein [Vibrio parahaemolyticus]EGQ8117920.1 hypothetical protein [Vibrio parahaemolyticus]TNZ83794.1 hypothetical protein CGK38_23495 [Vibrio parahaemolyticus]